MGVGTLCPDARPQGVDELVTREEAHVIDEPVNVLHFIEQTEGICLEDDSCITPRDKNPDEASLPAISAHRASIGKRPSAIADHFNTFSRNSFDEAETFFEVFGYFGLPMVVIFVVSALWTFTLAFIQVYPNEMANAIMNTTQIDDGQFWLLPQPDLGVIAVAVVLLVLFGLGYLWLAIYMVIFFRQTGQRTLKQEMTHEPTDSASIPTIKRSCNRVSSGLKATLHYLHDLPPLQRHYYNAVLDVPKLIFQAATLFTYLRRGFPTPLIYFYSILLLINFFVSSYRYQRYLVDPQLIVARLFYMYDLFFAVFATLVVLVYFIYDFRFDRATFEIRQATMSPMNFDRIARLYGDPAQISSFCSAFHYLQLSSASHIFFKASLNVLSLYKWRKIIVTLIENFHDKRRSVVKPLSHGISNDRCLDPQKKGAKQAVAPSTVNAAPPTSIASHRAWPMRIVGALFFLAGSALFTYSIVAVDSTAKLCHQYAHCIIYSYQWNVGLEHCTCLMFVDRQPVIKSFAEWNHPEDTTTNLAELAVAGELRIIQIINRALPEIPESVRNCHGLERIILIYSKTQHLPEWIGELHSMEYLHIEADLTPRRLQALPEGMFDHWDHFTFLHLGGIVDVPKVPSLLNLHHLQYLVLAGLESMTALPSFDSLGHLQNFLLADGTHIPKLPALTPLKSIKSFTLRFRNSMCCNGYLTGKCDLTAFACYPRANEPLVTCTDERIPTKDLAVLHSVDAFYCPTDGSDDIDLMMITPTSYTTDGLCGGVLYKQCELNNLTGICFNSRMQVINCVIIPEYQVMRRIQIERGVGDPCDPEVEAWLGCS